MKDKSKPFFTSEVASAILSLDTDPRWRIFQDYILAWQESRAHMIGMGAVPQEEVVKLQAEYRVLQTMLDLADASEAKVKKDNNG